MDNQEMDLSVVIERTNRFLEERGISQEKFARMADISGGSLSTFLSGKYSGRADNVAKKILSALEAEENRAYAQSTVREPEIVRTKVMEKIWLGLQYASARNDIVVVDGPPGIGKTCALKKWVESHANSLFMTASPNIKTGRDIMEEILEVLNKKAEGRNKLLEKNIISALKNTNRALLIDEAHFLRLEGFETLRRIYDETRCPIILAGNPKIMDMITEKNKSVTGQFFSRAVRIALNTTVEMEDVKKVVQQNGVQLDEECLYELHRAANEIGSLRVMTKLFLFAWTLANEDDLPVAIDHIRQAREMIISV